MKLLLYCCKDKRGYLHKDIREDSPRKYYLSPDSSPFDTYEPDNYLNGKIVAECDYEVEEIRADYGSNHIGNIDMDDRYDYYVNSLRDEYELCKKSSLTMEELDNYLLGENGYAIHIKNLKERVMELSDCSKYIQDNILYGGKFLVPVKKAPQNMMKVWIYENGKWVMYILISVRPQWLCLELNGEKTVEVRKNVLKEMLQCQEK